MPANKKSEKVVTKTELINPSTLNYIGELIQDGNGYLGEKLDKILEVLVEIRNKLPFR